MAQISLSILKDQPTEGDLHQPEGRPFMGDNNHRVIFIVDLKKTDLHSLVEALLNTYGQLASHTNGRDPAR